MNFAEPAFGILSLLLPLVFMAIPIALLAYGLWLLTRLTRAVEGIEAHMAVDRPTGD